jgi:hypothetical protein
LEVVGVGDRFACVSGSFKSHGVKGGLADSS